ncbi:MAG: hypothetical protein OEN55_14610 [Alphaproteobacteria bacterium]|nr:hypothetical protein [Alphaproteobacteria bacterium]
MTTKDTQDTGREDHQENGDSPIQDEMATMMGRCGCGPMMAKMMAACMCGAQDGAKAEGEEPQSAE